MVSCTWCLVEQPYRSVNRRRPDGDATYARTHIYDEKHPSVCANPASNPSYRYETSHTGASFHKRTLRRTTTLQRYKPTVLKTNTTLVHLLAF